MKVTLRSVDGKEIYFDDLSPLTPQEHARLAAGESVTYAGKEYIFKTRLDDGSGIYVEKRAWMALHPLVQLDNQLKERYGK